MAFHDKAFTISTTGSVAATWPATNPGDFVFAVLSVDGPGSTFSSAGWASIGAAQNLTVDGQSIQLFQFTGGAPVSPPATSTFTASSDNTDIGAIVFSFSGRTLGAITFAQQTQKNSSTATPFTAALAGGTIVVGDDVFAILATDPPSAVGTTTLSTTGSPGTFVNQGTTNGGGSFSPIGLSTLDNATPGASGTISGAWTDTNNVASAWAGWVVSVEASSATAVFSCSFNAVASLSISGTASCSFGASGFLTAIDTNPYLALWDYTAFPAAWYDDALIQGQPITLWDEDFAQPNTGAISGTASCDFEATGTLTGAGALTGTASCDFESTGALTGSGALISTATCSFNATGALTGAGALTGTAPCSFAATGTLTGAGALAAAASCSFNAVGALTGAGALAATASCSFAATGALTGGGSLAATASCDFEATGVLTGSGTLAGSATCSFNATGTLTLTGTASCDFEASGALTATGVLAGTAACDFEAAGSLTGFGVITGTASCEFDASATPSLSGTASCDFEATGAITASGVLSGQASCAFDATGALTGSGALAGTASCEFDATATPNLTGTASAFFDASATFGNPIRGQASCDFEATGTLNGTGGILGTATCSFDASATPTVAGVASCIFDAAGDVHASYGGVSSAFFDATGTLSTGILGTASCSFNAVGTITNPTPPTPFIRSLLGGGGADIDEDLFFDTPSEKAEVEEFGHVGSYHAGEAAVDWELGGQTYSRGVTFREFEWSVRDGLQHDRDRDVFRTMAGVFYEWDELRKKQIRQAIIIGGVGIIAWKVLWWLF